MPAPLRETAGNVALVATTIGALDAEDRDVRELAAVLAARGAQRDCGVLPLLRRYERARGEDVRSMIAVTDTLQRLFSSRLPGANRFRNIGLQLTARLPIIRRALAQHALT